MSELEELTVAELREMAREQGIPVAGLNKADLVAALEEPDRSEESQAQAPDAEDASDNGGLIPIETRKSGRWWCPVCGHDQPTEVTTCEQCGAVREGTSVRPAGG